MKADVKLADVSDAIFYFKLPEPTNEAAPNIGLSAQ